MDTDSTASRTKVKAWEYFDLDDYKDVLAKDKVRFTEINKDQNTMENGDVRKDSITVP